MRNGPGGRTFNIGHGLVAATDIKKGDQVIYMPPYKWKANKDNKKEVPCFVRMTSDEFWDKVERDASYV